MNSFMKQKQIHRYTAQSCCCQSRRGVEEAWIGGLGFTDVTGMYEWITTGSYCTEEKSTSNIL